MKQPSNAAKRVGLPQLRLLRVGRVCSVTAVVMAVFLSPGSPRAGREGIPVLGMLGLGWRCRGSGEAAVGRAGRISNTLGFIGIAAGASYSRTSWPRDPKF